MNHFIEGFEKQAITKINLAPIKPKVADASKGILGRARDFIEKHRTSPKTRIGMGLVGAAALLGGAYKATDALIGTPSHDGQDW